MSGVSNIAISVLFLQHDPCTGKPVWSCTSDHQYGATSPPSFTVSIFLGFKLRLPTESRELPRCHNSHNPGKSYFIALSTMQCESFMRDGVVCRNKSWEEEDGLYLRSGPKGIICSSLRFPELAGCEGSQRAHCTMELVISTPAPFLEPPAPSGWAGLPHQGLTTYFHIPASTGEARRQRGCLPGIFAHCFHGALTSQTIPEL